LGAVLSIFLLVAVGIIAGEEFSKIGTIESVDESTFWTDLDNKDEFKLTDLGFNLGFGFYKGGSKNNSQLDPKLGEWKIENISRQRNDSGIPQKTTKKAGDLYPCGDTDL
jgi:hypothetical protein